jgi:rhodanese-related sulfurtransferase
LALVQDIDNGEMLRRLADGALYLDVRTPEEFSAGHAPGAYNVPLFLRGADGAFVDNPEFLTIARSLLAADAAPIVACQAGGRSRKACTLLEAAGQKDLLHFAGGYGGSRDAFGARIAGFVDSGSPSATAPEPGRSYPELRERFGGSPRSPGPHGPP